MDEIVKKEYLLYLSKIEINSVKEEWVLKNLKNLYDFLKDIDGETLSEKIYLIEKNKSFCKVCCSKVKFLSYKRGYREYCSKSCSNNDQDLIGEKLQSYKKNNLKKYGVENPSMLDSVKDKISLSKEKLDYNKIDEKYKKTFIEKYGVDNPSKLNSVKKKKKETTIKNWGVDNPFQSEFLKEKSKKTLLEKYGVEHPLKSSLIKESIKKKNIERYGVDNYTKTDVYKNLMFDKYHSCNIKTNLNSDPNYIKYIGLGEYELSCDCGESHNYITNSHLYHSRKRLGNKQCVSCFPITNSQSSKEKNLLEWIKTIYSGEVISGYRDGLEIDIYLPEMKIGFEFNGLYWHCEIFKTKNYHLDKLNYFKERDIKIINIWEDDWDLKNNIVKSQIKNWLGKTNTRIWARKCEVKIVDDLKTIRSFLNESHIQGYVSSSLKIGLFYENEMVSLMTFDHFEGRRKMKDNEWNLSRFCNKVGFNVIGGASKLLSYFKKIKEPNRIISFADKSWSTGELYYKLDFYLKSTSYPNYSYFIDKKRVNKQRYKKSKLIKMGFDEKKSESKIMEDDFGSYKIFDCGQLKFEWKAKTTE